MKNQIFYLALIGGFCLILLESCNNTENAVSTETEEVGQPNPTLKTNEPIHAIGGIIEEDPEDINHQLSAHAGALTPEEVMKMYYPHETEQDKEVITISKQELEDASVKVTLVDDNMADDAQKTIKIEMTLMPVGSAWKVLKIQKQWKCYEGRGHTDWGIQSCN